MKTGNFNEECMIIILKQIIFKLENLKSYIILKSTEITQLRRIKNTFNFLTNFFEGILDLIKVSSPK